MLQEIAETIVQAAQMRIIMMKGREQDISTRVCKGECSSVKKWVEMRDEDSDGEDEVDLKRQLRMMDRTIKELNRKNESLELRLDRETKMSRTNKSMLSGQEMNFVKDVNDFCKEKLFPSEKFSEIIGRIISLMIAGVSTVCAWIIFQFQKDLTQRTFGEGWLYRRSETNSTRA
jgi:hypothetical protein